MSRTCWLRIAFAAAVTLVLAASAQPAGGEEGLSEEAVDALIGQEMKKMQQREAAAYPCRLFSTEEIADLVGNPVDSGAHTFEHRTENEYHFRAENCAWSAASGDGGDVSLWVSRKENFDSGKVECYPGSGAAGAAGFAGLGTETWWNFQKYFGMGTLRVCATSALLEVQVSKKGADEGTAQGMARKIAEKVLAAP